MLGMTIGQVLLGLPVLALGALLLKACYNVTLHPLRSYPGPKLWAASRLPLIYCNVSGRLMYEVMDLHNKYGDVVRIGPDELSYITGTAWKTICGHRSPEMPKSLHGHGHFKPSNGVHGILTVPENAEHARMRRSIAPAFSDRALRDQETFVHTYVDALIALLQRAADSRAPIDIMEYFNFTTFDIIGDLAFGESFDCLRHNTLHMWIKFIFGTISAIPYMQALQYFGLDTLLPLIAPKSMVKSRQAHAEMSEAKLARRLEKGINKERGDFFSQVLDVPEAKAMTPGELQMLAQILIVGGSETTATTLSAAAYYLMTNKGVYDKLVNEIRSAFQSEEEINLITVGQLKYLAAVLEESLRMFPPVPASLPRVVPRGGEVIDGKYVPAGACVGVSQYAAYHSPTNFAEPLSFIPERFEPETDEERQKFAHDNKAVLQPFSVGPRNCVGRTLAYAEMKIITSRLLWNFDLEIGPGSDTWIGTQKANIIWEKEPLMAHITVRPGRPEKS